MNLIEKVKQHKQAAAELLEQGYHGFANGHENLAFKYAVEALRQGYTREDFLRHGIVCPVIAAS